MSKSRSKAKIIKNTYKKRKKTLISPGEKLLKKIRPYSSSILTLPIGLFRFSNEAEDIIFSIQTSIYEIQSNKIYFALQNDKANRWLALQIFDILRCAKIYNEPPTLKEFSDDVSVFLQIAEKHPKLISTVAEALNDKYGGLSHVSEDFDSWSMWLWHSNKPKSTLPSLWRDFESHQSFSQSEAIDFANSVLDVIPSDPGIRNGRPKNYGLRQIIEAVDRHWIGCSFNPKDNRVVFYSYLEQLNAALYEKWGTKMDDISPQILKPNLCSERNLIRQIIEKQVPVKTWKGHPELITYFIGNARFGSFQWLKRNILTTITQARRLPNSRERRSRMYQMYKKQFLSNMFNIRWLLKFLCLFFSAK